MLTRCPACATHFRVTPDQLKVRSGRVRCGQCQQVFNALDVLIEEPILAITPPRRDTEPGQRPDPVTPPPELSTVAQPDPSTMAQPVSGIDVALPDTGDEVPAVPPAPTFEQAAEESNGLSIETTIVPTDAPAGPATEPARVDDAAPDLGPAAPESSEAAPPAIEPAGPDADATAPSAAVEAEAATADGDIGFPQPPPPPRRWPWMLGSLIAVAGLGVQAAIAYRVELAVLWPDARPALEIMCDFTGCEVGLPAKAALVGIEASDLHPDPASAGRLALTATLKNRAPFPQQFPHLELTLTDTADKALARKVLAPADYLPRSANVADGMPSNADIAVNVGIEAAGLTASGYRLYLFYP